MLTKTCFLIYSFYTFQNKISNTGTFLKSVFNSKLLNNHQGWCFFINLDFLSVFFYTLSNMITLFYILFKLSRKHLFLLHQLFQNFKTTANTARTKINFSIYFVFYLNIIISGKIWTLKTIKILFFIFIFFLINKFDNLSLLANSILHSLPFPS